MVNMNFTTCQLISSDMPNIFPDCAIWGISLFGLLVFVIAILVYFFRDEIIPALESIDRKYEREQKRIEEMNARLR